MEPDDRQYPEGHFVGLWMGIGIAMFSGIGVALSVAAQNFGLLGVGPALGVGVGLAIGQSIENKYRKEGKLRPMTAEEKRRKQRAVALGVLMAVFGVLAFVLLMVLR